MMTCKREREDRKECLQTNERKNDDNFEIYHLKPSHREIAIESKKKYGCKIKMTLDYKINFKSIVSLSLSAAALG